LENAFPRGVGGVKRFFFIGMEGTGSRWFLFKKEESRKEKKDPERGRPGFSFVKTALIPLRGEFGKARYWFYGGRKEKGEG